MIREFDLDAPKSEKPERLRFRSETRCVTALFEQCYKSSQATGKPWKILVEVVEMVERKNHVDLLGVLTVQVAGVVHDFFNLSASAKMEKSLEYLMDGIGLIAAQRQWNVVPFRDAEAEVRRRDFLNEWVWGSAIKNSAKSLSAEVLIRHGVDEAEISARFTDQDGNVVKVVHLVSDAPNEFIFGEYLGSFGWLDANTVELVSRNGRKRFMAHAI